MKKRTQPQPDPLPPLLAYIESAGEETRLLGRRKDAESAIARLYDEQAGLIEADKTAPAEIIAANTAVMEIADRVAEIEAELCPEMNGGGQGMDLREVLASARGQLVEARSALDHLVRASADRACRLSEMTTDIEAWDDRRLAVGQQLVALRRRKHQ